MIEPDVGNLSTVIEGVMNALSSAQQSEVKAWEQEMIACEHTLTLQQDEARELKDQNLATCSKCDLNENLWLCLVCGTLSCGRAQFGGGGGNGHGLQHVDTTGHTLAVKLGSITPEGTADVYCYSCDEERIDPMLQEHLLHWGIQLANRTKTEKSLQEMQIEQNMKWEFSMTSEDGKEMVPLFGPGFTGMKNIGNSCYLASVMQCLFSLSSFQHRFMDPFTQSPSSVVQRPADDLETQMRKMADGLLSGNFSIPKLSTHGEQDYQLGIAPTMIKALIGKGHSEFGTMRQQDAFEFLLYLTEKLDGLKAPQGSANPVNSFRFQVEQRTQCLGCKKVAYNVTTQDNISVLVPAREVKNTSEDAADGVKYEAIRVTELMNIFTKEEQVEYKCSDCSSSEGALKQILFKTFPKVLVLNPGRFSVQNWVPIKLEIPVLIPENGFNLDDYLSKGLQPGEELLANDVKADDDAVPLANESEVEQLMAMGFPRVRAEKALLTTKGNAEVAMEWLFAHMEDSDIDEPWQAPASSSMNIGKSSDAGVDVVIVSSLMDMGFPHTRCQKAAIATSNGGVESAMDWLMQHMDDADIDEPIPESKVDEDEQMADATDESTDAAVVGSANLPARYTAKAMACHKGSSIHAGHYVAFVKKEVEGVDDWVLFNDEKVLRGVDWEEASRTAYVYFFEQC